MSADGRSPLVSVVVPELDHLSARLISLLVDAGAGVALVTKVPPRRSFPSQVAVRLVDWSSERDLHPPLSHSDAVVISTHSNLSPEFDVTEGELLAEVSVAIGVGTLVLVSSSDAFGSDQPTITSLDNAHPTDGVGEGFLRLEEAVRRGVGASRSRLCVIRFPHVYGPNSALFEYVDRGLVPLSGEPETICSHLHIDDAARAIQMGILQGISGALTLADYEPMSWSSVIRLINRYRPEVTFDFVPETMVDRARKLLGIEHMAIRSGIAPGTGLGWRRDQTIQPADGWVLLGIEPHYPSLESGVASILGESSVDSVAS